RRPAGVTTTPRPGVVADRPAGAPAPCSRQPTNKPRKKSRMTTETAQPAAVEQGSSRDPYIDNARAILITLVVVGHLLRTVSSASSDIIDTWVYAFHMPAFVAISGYLSRSFTHKPRQLGRLLSALLVPYVIFQAI